jgi:alanine racemase
VAALASALPLPAFSRSVTAPARTRARRTPGDGPADYEPWLEVLTESLRHNVREVARLCGGRPVLGVVKNSAYGLGLAEVGPVLDALPEVSGLAVVKPAEALALREAGVRKPILLMGLCDETTGLELVRREVRLAVFTDDAGDLLGRLSRRLGRPIPVHLYLDTGMSRMGMSHRRAGPWIARLAARRDVRIEGTFTELAEVEGHDPVQLERFLAVARQVREHGVQLGPLHAASSYGVFLQRAAHLDLVRPGLALYGAYPAEVTDRGVADLRPAFRLKARVVRVERLEAGDGVSYGRNYVAERPTWVAVLPVGHADGYPRGAVRGCEVLIGGRLYRVIGAVSASHTIVEVGEEQRVAVGDEATLVGPDVAAIHPNTVAERAGISVYDVLMHLSAGLPKRAG